MKSDPFHPARHSMFDGHSQQAPVLQAQRQVFAGSGAARQPSGMPAGRRRSRLAAGAVPPWWGTSEDRGPWKPGTAAGLLTVPPHPVS